MRGQAWGLFAQKMKLLVAKLLSAGCLVWKEDRDPWSRDFLLFNHSIVVHTTDSPIPKSQLTALGLGLVLHGAGSQAWIFKASGAF